MPRTPRDFLEFIELCDALVLQTWGNLDRSASRGSPPPVLAGHPLHAGCGSSSSGSTGAWWPVLGPFELQENLRQRAAEVDVLDEFTGRGIGRALLGHAEDAGRRRRPHHPADLHGARRPDFDVRTGPDVLQARDRDRSAARRGTAASGSPRQAGYRLEQVERFSALDIPPAAGPSTPWNGTALTKAGEDYELLHWTDRCPEEYADQLAVLMSRMSTDAPSRRASYDAGSRGTWPASATSRTTWQRAGQDSLVAAARHRASGELAAYSVLQIAGRQTLAGRARTTPLSPPAHRGHRLGMLVKILNLRRLLAELPRGSSASSPSTPPKTTTCSPSTSRWGSGRRATTASGSAPHAVDGNARMPDAPAARQDRHDCRRRHGTRRNRHMLAVEARLSRAG